MIKAAVARRFMGAFYVCLGMWDGSYRWGTRLTFAWHCNNLNELGRNSLILRASVVQGSNTYLTLRYRSLSVGNLVTQPTSQSTPHCIIS